MPVLSNEGKDTNQNFEISLPPISNATSIIVTDGLPEEKTSKSVSNGLSPNQYEKIMEDLVYIKTKMDVIILKIDGLSIDQQPTENIWKLPFENHQSFEDAEMAIKNDGAARSSLVCIFFKELLHSIFNA